MNHATIQDSVDYLASIAFDSEDWLKNDVRELCEVSGCSRHVWLYDGVAFKFERRGEDNRNEYDLYHDHPHMNDQVRELMATPYAISPCSRVLAMELMDVTLRGRWVRDFGGPDNYENFDLEVKEKRRAFNADLLDRLQRAGFSYNQTSKLMTDNHPSNLAINFDGETRWIDYACPPGPTSY